MTKMEITVKYFLSICVLSLVANSTLAGVMPEEAKSSKIKQNQVQINALNYKVGNKNQKFIHAQQGELYKISNTNVYAYRTTKNSVSR
ncbi:hypothetical protein N9Y82_00025 [Amylibacter sp.]|jgi:hypothetical protein|nr:hypothetical protein [Amylibacter sp.]